MNALDVELFAKTYIKNWDSGNEQLITAMYCSDSQLLNSYGVNLESEIHTPNEFDSISDYLLIHDEFLLACKNLKINSQLKSVELFEDLTSPHFKIFLSVSVSLNEKVKVADNVNVELWLDENNLIKKEIFSDPTYALNDAIIELDLTSF